MLPCEQCEKRETCVAPCKELEDDLKRVEVTRREICFSELKEGFDTDYVLRQLKGQPCISEVASYFTEGRLDIPFKTQREVKNKCLHMFYFQHMSYRAIAKVLSYRGHGKGRKKVTVSTVRGYIQRGKAETRELFSISVRGENTPFWEID